MAIRQVRELNGEKFLSEPLEGFGSTYGETWGKYVEGAVPEDPSSIIADMPVGSYVTDDKPTAPTTVPAPYNKEVWITESGTFTAPVTGWYDVWMIGGGTSGGYYKDTSDHIAYGGDSGGVVNALVWLEQGEIVSCTIGAAGVAPTSSPYSVGSVGGDTVFGGITTATANRRSFKGSESRVAYTTGNAVSNGGGLGAGRWDSAPVWYGGGGSCSCVKNGSPIITNGYQGAVRLRYYDPNKEQN